MNLHKLHSINSLGIREVSFGDIRVERLEKRINPKVPFPHRHDFYQLILITQGAGSHKIDFTIHKVFPGQVFVMKPAQVHSWTFDKKIRGIIVEFSRESMSKEIIFPVETLPDVLSTFKNAKMVNLVEMMLLEYDAKALGFDQCIKKLLASFLIYLYRQSQKNEINSKDDIELSKKKKSNVVEELRKLIEVHFKQEHSVEFYADKLHTNGKALTMTISRACESSPRFLIQERLILEAKRLLGYSSLSVSEIGYELGFEDPNYFSRYFKKHMKMTPAQFRSKNKIY